MGLKSRNEQPVFETLFYRKVRRENTYILLGGPSDREDHDRFVPWAQKLRRRKPQTNLSGEHLIRVGHRQKSAALQPKNI